MTNWNRKSVRIGGSAVALAFMLTGSAGAINDHENRLTFSRPVALPGGVVLPAGTYSFELASEISHGVVAVRDRTGQKMFYRGITRPANLPPGMSWDTSIVLGEAPRNQARPITAWYELSSVNGHEFIY
jgi:hypothetical protein